MQSHNVGGIARIKVIGALEGDHSLVMGYSWFGLDLPYRREVPSGAMCVDAISGDEIAAAQESFLFVSFADALRVVRSEVVADFKVWCGGVLQKLIDESHQREVFFCFPKDKAELLSA